MALAGGALLVVGPVAEAKSAAPRATLTIVARGAPMEFRTLNMATTAFGLADGTQRTFKLRPGDYVVVQAPPVEGFTLRVACSDAVSSMDYDLSAGERLTCTFIAEQP
jgi:hypothetical protein